MSARIFVPVAVAAALANAAPAQAQHESHEMGAPTGDEADPHAGHDMPATDTMADTDHGAMDHGDMDHGVMAQEPMNHGDMDHGSMDHGQMDHGAMNHGAMEHDAPNVSPGPLMETPPPPEAGSGPPRAADAIWGAEAMRASRDDLRRNHGSFPLLWVQGDRVETQVRDGRDGYLWDVQGYYGTPTDRFWFKSEGEGSFGEPVEDAEVQALYSKAIAPFWDVQLGVRQDLVGPKRTYAVAGFQGLSRYMFEVDAALFLSQKGELTARIEAEIDQRITQRLTLQPRLEVALSAQDVPQLGIGSGLDQIDVGLRLRYQIAREFAPYVGVEQAWKIADSADYSRRNGEDPSVTNYVVGVRFWF